MSDKKTLSQKELSDMMREAAHTVFSSPRPQVEEPEKKHCALCEDEILPGQDFRTGLTKDRTSYEYFHTRCLDTLLDVSGNDVN